MHQHGKLLDAYIAVGAVLDTKVELHQVLADKVSSMGCMSNTGSMTGKVHSEFLAHSTDFSAIFLSSPEHGLFGDFKDIILSELLYTHKAAYKENTSVPARKAVIRVSEYSG